MKSWRNEKLASRGLSRAVLFQYSAFVASRARHRSRRGQSTFEKTVFFTSACFARGRRRAQKTSDRAPLVQFLLDKPLCVRGRRRNRVADRRGDRFPRVRVGEGLGGIFLVFPPLWPFEKVKMLRKPNKTEKMILSKSRFVARGESAEI